MTLSIRARLTLWYSGIVVLVMITAAVVASFAQSRIALQRIDDDLARTMATLEGVMRTEFGEGLTLEAAAEEASIEVVVPDRSLALSRPDGSFLAVWGLPVDRASLPGAGATTGLSTVAAQAGDARMLTRAVSHSGHTYTATVVAPLQAMRREHAEMVKAMAFGVLIALLLATAGGLLIARQTLWPLTAMAEQSTRVSARNPTERLSSPNVDDELGRLALAFNAVLDRLATALDQQRQFMADASHELRTPVTVVRTAAQVTLSSEKRTPDEYRESLVIVADQAMRLSRLVDAMFLLSRAEASGLPLRREFLNLDEILDEGARALRVLASQRDITLITKGDEEVGLTGDDELLRKMIGNLLDNAVRHADAGGRVVAIVRRASDSVTVRVTNDGPGIEPGDRERIFDRFVRIGGSSGAGLGLPIARWIAEAHGGSLRLESSEPGRTTFIVILPSDPVSDGSL